MCTACPDGFTSSPGSMSAGGVSTDFCFDPASGPPVPSAAPVEVASASSSWYIYVGAGIGAVALGMAAYCYYMQALQNKVADAQQQIMETAQKVEEGMRRQSGISMKKVSPNSQCVTKDASIPIGEFVTLTPRALMIKMLKLQAVHCDPTSMDECVRKVSAVVGERSDAVSSTGKEYDCFINYRVATDHDVAEKLYLQMKVAGFNPFLDKYCLKDGEDWKDGFMRGLRASKTFIALISNGGLKAARDPKRDHSGDNVLLEYEYALAVNALRKTSKQPDFILPVLVAELEGRSLVKFDGFNPELYPDSLKSQEVEVVSAREAEAAGSAAASFTAVMPGAK